MPTFTAVVLQRLLEPGDSDLVDKSVRDASLPTSKPLDAKLEQNCGKSVHERGVSLPHMSPALYPTPEAIPVANSPSSFTTNPYIINHKVCRERPLKRFSEDDVSSCQEFLSKETAEENSENAGVDGAKFKNSTFLTSCTTEQIEENVDDCLFSTSTGNSNVNDICDESVIVQQLDGTCNDEIGGKSEVRNQLNDSLEDTDMPTLMAVRSERESDSEEFYDPRESMSFASYTDGEDNAMAESASRFFSPLAEFHDSREGLLSDSELQTPIHNIESELHEMRIGLLMEIEKRKQAEESLNDMQSYWLTIREQLAQLGLTLPADPVAEAEGEKPVMKVAEELCHRFHITRFVAKSIGRGTAKAEQEMKMEAQIEVKNFEISRLSERLHYYEAVNGEMSQRNQEAVEKARRDRRKKTRRQRWIWGSVAALAALGAAVLAWTHLPSGKISVSTVSSEGLVSEDTSK